MRNDLLALKDKIVIASKYYDIEEIKHFKALGFTMFGESRVDSLLAKQALVDGVSWHFIGHLQKNKVKKAINTIDVLHSLDSLKLAELIDKYRSKPLKCFLQVNIDNSPTKHGFKIDEVKQAIDAIKKLKNIEIIGLMTIPDYTNNQKDTQLVYERLVSLQNMLYNDYKELTSLSIGMSECYKIALALNATHLRLGRIMKEVLNDV